MDNQLNFRYHELVDKQMLESLSALEKEKKETLEQAGIKSAAGNPCGQR